MWWKGFCRAFSIMMGLQISFARMYIHRSVCSRYVSLVSLLRRFLCDLICCTFVHPILLEKQVRVRNDNQYVRIVRLL